MDPSAASTVFEPVAVSTRSGLVESVHFGAAVVLDASGAVASTVGDAEVSIYARSSCKPLQAAAMLASGLELDDEALALACASHAGTPRHIAIAHRILAAAGRSEAALGNTPDLPLDRESAEAVLAHGGRRTSIQMNCSGKHAAMVATCVANGWDVVGYLEPEHPLQRAICDHITAMVGDVAHVGVDGCGAPAHVMSLTGLARAFRSLAHERSPVWRAMTSHPDVVGGERRDVTRLMRAVPGLMAKDGAEGVFAAALPDGVAAAVKVADGAGRAAGVVLAAVLAAAGVDVDPAAMGEPILGHGQPVGTVRSLVGTGWEAT